MDGCPRYDHENLDLGLSRSSRRRRMPLLEVTVKLEALAKITLKKNFQTLCGAWPLIVLFIKYRIKILEFLSSIERVPLSLGSRENLVYCIRKLLLITYPYNRWSMKHCAVLIYSRI